MEFFFMGAQILGGMALFMFSIRQLSNTLKKIAGVRLKILLKKATANPFKGAMVGTLVTFLVQSSSITVLLLLGFVNAGIMNLRQAIFVMLGSEIGTTITAQIVAFKVKVLFYPVMALGFALTTLSAREKIKNSGDILFSLVNVARFAEIHPETALAGSTAKFEQRFRQMEAVLSEQGKEMNC